jgi:hypothetical protein
MKKILIISGILVFLLLTTMIVVPIIFKPQLAKLVKMEANNNINATLDFESIGLNLFESFPNVSLNIKHLTLINKPPFEGDTLTRISTFKSTLDLMSLIKGKMVRVVSIVLDEPQIHLVALKDGTVNWNIFKTSENLKTEPVTQAKSNFNLMLQDYEIKDGTIFYDDQSSGMKVIANQLNHKGSGDFTQDHFQLLTFTKIKELSVGFAGINYLTKMKTQLKADIDVNAKDRKITLKENELQLNQLILSFDGFVTMQGKEMVTDLKFKTNQNDLKNILSLIPAIYKKNLADLKTSGQAALQGYIEGAYRKNHYPAFHLQLSINDGMFQYAQSPSQVNHINLDLVVHNPGGIPDNTLFNLKKCHVEINQEPLDVTLQVKTPISDPYFIATAKGNINLLDIKNIMPSEKSMDLTGFVSSDLFVEGNLSSIQNNQYHRYQAHGHLSFKDINYSGPAIPVKVRVQQANLEFMPEKVSLNNFQALFGKSDIFAAGSLDHVLPYLLKGQTLKGNLTVNSTFFDLNPWLAGQSKQRTAIELPAGMEFTWNSTFKEVLFGKFKITNVSGMLALKDKMLHLIDLKLNVLNGSLIANGTYSKLKDTPAHSFFGLKISNFSIGEAFQNFLTVQKFVPIAKSIQGNFDATLELVTDLDSTLTPVFHTINSRGSLIIQKVLVENFKPLDVVADILKMEKLRKLVVENIEPSYTIRDGRLNLAPLNFKIENTEFIVAGSNGIDMSMDYLMKLIIPAKELNNQTNAVINNIFNKKIDLFQEDHVVLDVSFKGTIDKPDVNLSGRDILKGATVKLIDIAKQEILKQKVILPDTVRKEIEKQKFQLEQLKKIFNKK